MKKLTALLLAAVCMAGTLSACSDESEKSIFIDGGTRENTLYSVVATDALDRSFGEIIGLDDSKEVGIFYLLWLGQHETADIYDISKMLEEYGNTWDNPIYRIDWDSKVGGDGPDKDKLVSEVSPLNAFHFWGEPLYGYYSMSDPWVIRRHMEELTFSQIDFLAVDATNALWYPTPLLTLMSVIEEMIDEGWDPPRVMLYTNTNTYSTIMDVYTQLYSQGLHSKAWYTRDGKPAIVGSALGDSGGETIDQLPDEVKEFFTLVKGQWPFNPPDPEAMPWIDWEYPQYNYNGVMNVGVSLHIANPYSRSMYPDASEAIYHANWGRGFDVTTYTNHRDQVESGPLFQSLWNTVHENRSEVNTVFVTGWNEWIVQKLVGHAITGQTPAYVDAFNEEFSRDVEMMKGGYGDNYYLQNMDNIRRYKASASGTVYTHTATVGLNDADWGNSGRRYYDVTGDAIERDFVGAAPTVYYTDDSNRNDIASVQLANDEQYLYVRIETATPIILDREGTECFNVFFKTTENKNSRNWEGYQYVLNRKIGDGKTTLSRCTGNGYEWEDVAQCDFVYTERSISIRVPLSAMNLTGPEISLDFKVADNVTDPDDIMSYYIYGDSAPIGRLNYRYNSRVK